MSDNIKVVVKVRPLISREVEDGAQILWRARNNTLCQLDSSGRDTTPTYTFDKVYDADTATEAVYNDIAKPIVEAAIAGINGTIFAYGQTSSGKTYTMMGDKDSPGILPLAIHDIFERIKNIPSRDFLLRVSYIEIYNETIKDLLNITKDKIKVHETHGGAVKVDATEEVRTTPEEVLDIMKQGDANRQKGATNMNEQSSRSHTIFQITIESREHTEEDEEASCVNVSQLNLVDLAGSERSGQTGATGLRFKEGTHINKSLSALGLVIKQLSEADKYVNYRDSKLTRILQNSLGGNAKTSIICAVTPAAGEETVSTLQFANRAKAIKNKPEVNAVATNATMLQGLTKRLAALQYDLENKKHVEDDNERLQQKISKLKKLIIFGMTRPSERVDRRKTWCAPRRATISTLMPIQEENPAVVVPRFCTPVPNKYSQPESTSFVTIKRSSNIPEANEEEEEPVTPPTRRKHGFTGEVITLDDSDEETDNSKGLCSPYHKCYERSKTPPCVLRDKARKVELNYNNLVELTDREKIYSPKTAELMERLDKNSTTLESLKNELDKFKDLCEEKDKEITILKKQNQKYEQEIQSLKVDLGAMCDEYKSRITDLEVCLENARVKSKDRETELLSLFEEKNPSSKDNLSDKSQAREKTPASDLSTFLNLSKDISLVDSENEMSLPSSGHDKLSNNDNIISEQNELIRELKKKLNNSHQTIKMYSGELGAYASEKINLQSAISEFEKTIEDLNAQLLQANKDIKCYKNLLFELKTQLHGHDCETEQKLSDNNEEISMILSAFKKVIDMKNESDSKKSYFEDYREIIQLKNQELVALESSIGELKNTCDMKQESIVSLTNENLEMLKMHNELLNDNQKVTSESFEKDKQIKEYKAKHNELQLKIEESAKSREDLLNKMHSLSTQINYANTKMSTLEETIESQTNEKKEMLKMHDELLNDNQKVTLESFEKDKNTEHYKAKHKELHLKIEESAKSREDLLKTIHSLSTQINNANTKMSTLEETIERQTNEKIEMLKMHNELLNDNQKVSLESLEKDKKIEQYKAKHNELHLKIEESAKSREDLLNKIHSLSTQINVANTKISTLEETIEIQTNEKVEMFGTHIKISNDNQILTLETSKLLKEIEKSKCVISELKRINLNKDEIIEDYSAKLEKFYLEIPEKEKSLDSLIQENQDLINKINALENMIIDANLKISTLKEQLRNEVNHLNSQVNEKNEEIKNINDTFLEAITENDSLKTKSAQLELRNREHEEDISLKESTIENLQKSIAECNTCLYEATTHKNELANQIELLENKIRTQVNEKHTLLKQLTCNENELKKQLTDLNEEMVKSEQLRLEINEKDELLINTANKITSLIEKAGLPISRTSVTSDSIDILLMNLEECICKLQETHTYSPHITDNLEEKTQPSIKTLEIKIQNQEEQLQIMNKIYDEKVLQINKLTDLNHVANSDVLKHQNIIEDLKSELLCKSIQLNDVSEKLLNMDKMMLEKLMKFDESVVLLGGRVDNMKKTIRSYETTQSKFLNAAVKIKVSEKTLKPPTLRDLSLKKINKDLLKYYSKPTSTTPVALEQTNIDAGTQIDGELSDQPNSAVANLVDQQRNENTQLLQKIYKLDASNKKIKSDFDLVSEEVKLLIGPANDLFKQISKHRTQLSTLTATTYAENKLLKSKVKALHHHHDRLHSVCQREVPELREQLCKLQDILQNHPPNIGVPQCEYVNQDQTVNSPNIPSNEVSLSKLSLATLGSDTLMLENNFTLGPSANSTMISHNDGGDISVTICENLEVTEIPRVSDNSCQTDEPVLGNSQDLKSMHNISNERLQNCCNYDVEIFSDLELKYEEFIMSSDLLKQVLPKHSQNCIINKYHIIANLLELKEKEIEDSLKRVNTLNHDKAHLEGRVRQMQKLEDDIHKRVVEIENLSHTVEALKTKVSQLQTENESLSNEIMESVLENDSLKDKLTQMEIENSTENKKECIECLKKENIILSLKKNETSMENMVHNFNKSIAHSSEESLDASKDSLRHDKTCSLQSELLASREECKKMTEEVSTIRNQLIKSEELTQKIQVNLKNRIAVDQPSLYSDDISQDMSIRDTNGISIEYENDKLECINFLHIKKIYDEENTFSTDKPIINMMKYLYDTLWTTHSNELENLTNKIKQFEEDKFNIHVEVKKLAESYETVNKKLQNEMENQDALVTKLNILRENNELLQKQITYLDNTESDISSQCTILSQNMLKPLDEEFGFSTSEIFDRLILALGKIYEIDLNNSKTKCADLENQLKTLSHELNTANLKLVSANEIFSKNKDELELLKAQKDKMYQISNGVTKSLVLMEERLKELISNSAQSLINENFMSMSDLDFSLPTIEVVSQMYGHFTRIMKVLKANANKENAKSSELIMQNKNFEETVLTIKSELLAKEETIRNLKLENDRSDGTINKLTHEYAAQVQIGETLKVELCSVKNDLSGCFSKINYLEQKELHEKLEKIKQLELEHTNLKSVNTMLMNENKEFTMQLETSLKKVNEQKNELENIRTTLEQVQQTNELLMNSLDQWKIKSKNQSEELLQTNNLLKEKCEEVFLLEKNMKTHQRTTDIQASMCKRLHQEKEDLEHQLKEKSDEILHLMANCTSLQAELDELRNIKNTIELQLKEPSQELEGTQKSGRSSMDTIKTDTRRRRQSVHDLQRTVANIDEASTPEDQNPENIFGSCLSSRHLFLDSKPGSQRNSIESIGKSDYKNGNFSNMTCEILCEGEDNRGGVTVRRRRRQSIHDQNRSPAVQLLFGNQEDVSPAGELETHNRKLQEEVDRLKSTIESGAITDDYYKGEVTRLKRELELCKSDYEELQQKYREVDEECEMCAEAMHESRELCVKLGREKKELENQLTETKKRLGGGDAHTNTTKQTTDTHTNTDVDWKKLHSAVVDRMSYDAEVEKRKKLAKSAEALHTKNKELKETIVKLQAQIQQYPPTQDNMSELHKLREQLELCRRQYEQLQSKYQELDEECEQCAQVIREKDDYCARLVEQKTALETKVTDLQQLLNSANSVTQSTRKKRQSCHDVNRDGVGTSDASTNTDGGALSALGVDHMTHHAEKEKRHRLQAAYEALKTKNSELTGELRRLQRARHVNESTVDMMQLAPTLDKDFVHKQTLEIEQLRTKVEELQMKNQQMCQRLQSLAATHPPSPALMLPPPPAILVATGSAIVQNQQLCDFMKENQRLKKVNQKLVNLCKKRGKLDTDGNQENVQPET